MARDEIARERSSTLASIDEYKGWIEFPPFLPRNDRDLCRAYFAAHMCAFALGIVGNGVAAKNVSETQRGLAILYSAVQSLRALTRTMLARGWPTRNYQYGTFRAASVLQAINERAGQSLTYCILSLRKEPMRSTLDGVLSISDGAFDSLVAEEVTPEACAELKTWFPEAQNPNLVRDVLVDLEAEVRQAVVGMAKSRADASLNDLVGESFGPKVETPDKRAREGILELKPNFFGFGLNLPALWRWIRRYGK